MSFPPGYHSPYPRKDLDIIVSHIDLAGAEIELSGEVGGQSILHDKLRPIKESMRYDYGVIDASPSSVFSPSTH